MAPVAIDIASPKGGEAIRSPMPYLESWTLIAHPARPRKAGTVTNAVQPMALKPLRTSSVTPSPVISAQTHSGGPPTRDRRPSANTAVWTPNHPKRLTVMTRPIRVEPYRPNPVQRASTEVDRPSRIPAIPTKTHTTSRITEPRVRAQNAPQNDSPAPKVAPSRNWVRSDS
nr:hypothetical protein GCM10010200_101710 [Actinomadura rugatobispora]